jgi:hypothetical protein
MNYLLHTTTIELNNKVYKYERLQKWNENSHKASNTFFCNGIKLKGHERTQTKEMIFESGSYSNEEIFTEKRWVK